MMDPKKMEQMQQKQQEMAAKQAEMEEKRQMMLTQVCSAEARERLARVSLVKPDDARRVEDTILQRASQGALREKVSEGMVKEMLSSYTSQKKKTTKITFQRKRYDDDDDDDDDDFDDL